MPEDVTAPSVLTGHAREIWKSAFLSAYSDTCKDREDKDECAAKIAWSAVKNVYKKDKKTGEWIERAEDDTRGDGMDQYPSPISASDSVAPIPAGLPDEARAIFEMAYEDALRVECSQASEPRKCALQKAWQKVYEDYYKSDNGQWVKRNMLDKFITKHYGPGNHPSGTPQAVHGGGGLRAGVAGESGRTLKPMHKYTSESRQPGELGMDSIDPQGKYYRITNDAFSREFYLNDIGKVFSERPMYAPSVELTGEQVLAEWEADFDPFSENVWENPANLSSLKTLQSELGEEAGLTSWVKIYGTDTASYMTDTRTVDRMLELLKDQYDNADRANNKNQRNAIKRLMGIFMDRKRELTNKSVAMTAEAFQARRFFDRKKREKLAESGKALPWGGFPIENCEDVKNAVRAIGRAKDRSRTIAHIKKHAKSLGCSHLIPKKWRSGNGSEEKSVAATEDSKFYETEETLVHRAKVAGIDASVLLKRRSARAKAHAEDIALLEAGYADHPARRPDDIPSEVWRTMEPHLRTVGAVVWRRHVERKYEEAVEDALLKGWKGEKNTSRPEEWIFKSWVDTPDGWQLVRTILVRRADSDEWYMKEISRGASKSLAIRVAPHEARR